MWRYYNDIASYDVRRRNIVVGVIYKIDVVVVTIDVILFIMFVFPRSRWTVWLYYTEWMREPRHDGRRHNNDITTIRPPHTARVNPKTTKGPRGCVHLDTPSSGSFSIETLRHTSPPEQVARVLTDATKIKKWKRDKLYIILKKNNLKTF